MTDARVAAFLASWDAIENAVKLSEKYPDRDTAPYTDLLMDMADVYARLACSAKFVGVEAGAVMAERANRLTVNKKANEKLMKEVFGE